MKIPENVPDRFGPIEHVEVTGSTNADLLARAARGSPSGLVLVADHQTAGRGRQNRQWVNRAGESLLVSVLLRPEPGLISLVTIIAGLAVVDAVQSLAPSTSATLVGLKWPNDVLVPSLGDRKLAGILAESNIVGTGTQAVSAVVVGTGVNLLPLPQLDELTANAVSLSEVLGADADFSRPTMLGAYLDALDNRLSQAETAGHSSVLASYRSCCLTLGRQVRFVTPTGTVEGEAVQIADDGALVLDTDAGRETLRAGDAHHLPRS